MVGAIGCATPAGGMSGILPRRAMEKPEVSPSAPVPKGALEVFAKKSPELLAGIKGIELTPVSLTVTKAATLNDLKVFGERLGLRVRSYQWFVGDWFHQGFE